MGPSRLGRAWVVAALSCLCVTVVPSPATGDTPPSGDPAVASPAPTPTASGPPAPSEDEVLKAQAAAAVVARSVADLTAEIDLVEARLLTLQRKVATVVAAEEQAQQELTRAEAQARRATDDVAAARRAKADAARLLSRTAAGMYMQGGDLEDLTMLVLASPAVLSDLAVVLEHEASDARQIRDAATAAAAAAASTEQRLVAARDARAKAVGEVTAQRSQVEEAAAVAGAEADQLGTRHTALTAQLTELEKGTADLVERRQAAARLDQTQLLGVQADGSVGSGPQAARDIAVSMMAARGWDAAEFTCLVELWHGESGWSWSATNPSSGAYGIPQSLPGWKMAAAGGDWLTNPATQITWGLDYIASRYGSPCAAQAQWLARSPHWY